ncbi:MAG: hypothetical protein IPF94_13980 [Betaproteobacteria bacterium]|nr:hypothetical protein [Betaproteobacteria bacterium]
MTMADTNRDQQVSTRRRMLTRISAALVTMGLGKATASTPSGGLKSVQIRDVARIDAAGGDGWLARDHSGRLWQVLEDGSTRLLGEGLAAEGALNARHGRIAGRSIDGHLWVRSDAAASAGAERSSARLAPHGGLCVLPLAVIGLIEQEGLTRLARFEPDARNRWQVVAQSTDAVLPDAVPVVADLDGRDDGGHVAVLAGPDRNRYPHAVLGDDVEATRVLWLDRHSLQPLRTLRLDEPEVLEDRHLRPWRLPDGRQGLVTVRSGPSGAQLAVIAASLHAGSALEIAAAGPYIGTRNRWLSPASVEPRGAELWAVHTPHIGGVLHRYRATGAGLTAEPVASGLTNHRLGARDLDVTALMGRLLLLPSQNWQQVRVVDLETKAIVSTFQADEPVLQLVTAPNGRAVAMLTMSGLSIYAMR